MKAVILAGGLGTRLSEETATRPKPMVEIGGKPILWHIMKMYSHHGIKDFIVCCGYKGYLIKEYLFKDFSLSDIKSLGFTATDAKCSNGSTGPLAVSCRKSGLDFKCRFIELSVKYEHVCLSTFSLQ